MPTEQTLRALPPATAVGRDAAANMLFAEVLFWTQRAKAVAIIEDLDFDSSAAQAPVRPAPQTCCSRRCCSGRNVPRRWPS
jgi:hypothetical protein